MKWFRNTELSDRDFNALVGTTTMESLLENKLVIAISPKEERPTFKSLSITDSVGLYYISTIDDYTFEIMFSNKDDFTRVEHVLTQLKMSTD